MCICLCWRLLKCSFEQLQQDCKTRAVLPHQLSNHCTRREQLEKMGVDLVGSRARQQQQQGAGDLDFDRMDDKQVRN